MRVPSAEHGLPFVTAHSSRKPGAFSALPVRDVPDMYLALRGGGGGERGFFKST